MTTSHARRHLLGATLAGAALLLTSCSPDPGSASGPSETPPAPEGPARALMSRGATFCKDAVSAASTAADSSLKAHTFVASNAYLHEQAGPGGKPQIQRWACPS